MPEFATDSTQLECLACGVSVDKQISCNGGGSFTDVTGVDDPDGTATAGCLGWTGDDEISFSYVVTNTGEVDVVSCALTDSNGVLSPAGPGSLLVGGGTSVEIPNVVCNDTLEAGEPDTATFDCLCAATVNGVPLIPEILPDFGDCNAVDTDSAQVACLSTGLDIVKTCEDTNGNGASDTVRVIVTNGGEADLVNCQVVATTHPGAWSAL